MTLGELKEEVRLIIRDPRAQDYLDRWVNNAILEIATDFDLPYLAKIEPFAFSVTKSNWLYDLPESWHKKLFKCKRGANRDYDITIRRNIEGIDNLDPDHDQTGDYVESIAYCDERRKLACYPKADDTLYLWFYSKPTYLDSDSQSVACIPEAYQARVIIPKVVIQNFKALQDMAVETPSQGLAFWITEYRKGLYGEYLGDIGMLNYFAKTRGVRRHGGVDPLP